MPAAFLGKVGNDPFGLFLRDTLADEGVDVSRMLFSDTANTGLAFAWTEDATGEARYLYYRQPSADRLLSAQEIDRLWLASATALQFGSLLLAAEPGSSAVWSALNLAYHSGVACIYDVNMRLPAWNNPAIARATMLQPLEASEVVKLNRHELTFLTGEENIIRGVDRLWRSRQSLLVVTLDRAGCYFRTASGDGWLPGYEVNVVDTVGCGDAFTAALVAQILRHNGLNSSDIDFESFDFEDLAGVESVCRYATAAGALAATQPGAIPAMPTRRQVEYFLG